MTAHNLPRPVRHDLARLVESEDLGEAFFAAAAAATSNERFAREWSALHQLEAQTNRGVRDRIRRIEFQGSATNGVAAGVGGAGGRTMHLLPRSLQMSGLRQGTRRYLPAFRRLAEFYRGGEHADFFDYVVAHELAIIAFAERSRRQDGSALDPVHRLLDCGVPE